jgi:hypothetical protein
MTIASWEIRSESPEDTQPEDTTDAVDEDTIPEDTTQAQAENTTDEIINTQASPEQTTPEDTADATPEETTPEATVDAVDESTTDAVSEQTTPEATTDEVSIETPVELITKEITEESPVTTNLTFVIDVSSSMSNTDIDLSEEAVNSIISQYEELGNVHVNIVQFWGNNAQQTGWQDGDGFDADDVLYKDKSGTDPEQGMRLAADSYDGTQPSADQNILFMLGDGNSYGSYEDDFLDFLPEWKEFIAENIDSMQTVGINTSNLKDLDYAAGIKQPSEISDSEYATHTDISSIAKDTIYANDIDDFADLVNDVAEVVVTEVVDVEAMQEAGYTLNANGVWVETTVTSENTIDEQTTDSIDEQTTDAVDENTVAEETVDEQTTSSIPEVTTDEQTTDATSESTIDEQTTDASDEATTPEDTSIPEDTTAEQTIDATDEQTTDIPESTEVTTETLVESSEIIYLPNEDGTTGQDTNLVITLDVSGSMAGPQWDGVIELDDGTTTTRFEIAKESLISTIESYQESGAVDVNLTLFGQNAQNIGWMNGDDAIEYVNSLTMSDDGYHIYQDGSELDISTLYTDYYDGISATDDINFNGHDADKTVGFFISDGKPNDNEWRVNSDNDSAIENWKSFVEDNMDELNVIGVGSGADESYLNIIQTESGKSAVMITDDTKLGDALEDIVVETTPVVDEAAMLEAGYTLNSDGKWVSSVTQTIDDGTSPEETIDAVAEQTTDEQTQDAQTENTTDEQTIDGVDEETTDALAESTTDESTIAEDTYDNSGADKSNLNQAGDSTGIIALGHDVDDLSIEIKSYKPSKDEGEVILYKDGEEVARISIDDVYDSSNNDDTTITINDGTIFDSYEVIHSGNSFGWGWNSGEFKIGGAYENSGSESTTPEDTTDAIPEATTDAVAENTTDEDTNYTPVEDTTDEQTTDATTESTIDEQTTDATAEQTIPEDTIAGSAENTTDEQTIPEVSESTTDEDTTDAVAEDTVGSIINTPASDEQTIAEDTTDAVAEETAPEQTTPEVQEVTTDEDTIDAVDENTADEETTDGVAEDTVAEDTTDGVDEQTTDEDTQNAGDETTTDEQTIEAQAEGGSIYYDSTEASYNNVVGVYTLNADGNPTEAQVLIDNQHDVSGGDKIGDLPAGSYAFFIIANGASEIEADSVVTFDTSAEVPVLLIDGEPASHPVYYSNSAFNPNGNEHFQIEPDGNGGTNIKIEDLPNLGDHDFDDVVMHTDFNVAVDEDTIPEDTSYSGIPEATIPEATTDAVAEDTTNPIVLVAASAEDTVDEDTVDAIDEDTIEDVVHTPASPEATTDEATIDAIDEDTTAEDTTDAIAEDTTDEDTADATPESTTAESTTDAIAEETSDVVNEEAVAEDTTDEATTDAIPESTTAEATTDAVAEDTTNPIVLVAASAEDTVDEDTIPAVEEDTTDDVVHTPASPEDTTDEATTDAVDEDTTAEDTTDAIAEDTTDEDTADATPESTTAESTTDAIAEETSDVVNEEAVAEDTTDEDTTETVSESTTDAVINTPASNESTIDSVVITAASAEDTVDEDTVDAIDEDTIEDVVHTPASPEATTDEATIDAIDEDTTAEDTTDAIAENTTDEDTADVTTETTVDEIINTQASDEDTIDEDTPDENIDSLLATGDMEIDLSALSAQHSDIDVLNLNEGSQNITSLTLEDVLEVTDVDNVLRIDGDNSDSLDLNTVGPDAEWTLGDFKTDAESDQVYQEITGVEGDSTVTLEINTNIEINES